MFILVTIVQITYFALMHKLLMLKKVQECILYIGRSKNFLLPAPRPTSVIYNKQDKNCSDLQQINTYLQGNTAALIEALPFQFFSFGIFFRAL